MGKIKNELSKNEIEILYRIYKQYLLEQEIVYLKEVDVSFYKLFDKLIKLRGKYEKLLNK